MATILNNKKSTGGSPYCYYTVTANTSNRTAYGVTISGTITAHLASSSSSLGTGQSMGLNAYLTFNGVEQSAVSIKGTGTSWSGTSNHNTNYSFTISNLDPSQTVIPVSFRVSRTGSAAGDYSRGAALSSTTCTSLDVEAGLIASTITSVSSGTTDYYPSVVWTPCATSVKFKVKYSYGSWSYTTGIITPSTTSAYTYSGYAITGANLASYMSSGSGTFTATLYTYDSDGTTQIGNASSKTFTVTLNASYKPTASVGTFTDVGGLVPSGWGIFVQGKSKLSFTVSATASTGSTISSYSTSVNGATYNTTSITTSWLTGSGSANLTVTDSRSRTATASRSYTVYPYSNPVITTASVTRCLSDGTPDESGTCLLYSFASTISSCNGNNTATYELGYKEKSASTYTYVTINNNATNAVYTGYTFVATTSYDIRFRATDAFNEVVWEDEDISSGFKLVHYNKNKKAIAIGKYSSAGTNDKKFEVAMDEDIEGVLRIHKEGIDTSIGPLNSYYFHFFTDQNKSFYFNRQIECGGNIWAIKSSGEATTGASNATMGNIFFFANDTDLGVYLGNYGDMLRYNTTNGRQLAGGIWRIWTPTYSHMAQIQRRYMRVRATSDQTPSGDTINVVFQACDINMAPNDLELKTDGKVTVISYDVHHIKVSCTLWVERGSTSYAWCHLWVGGTDVCNYMIPNKNGGESWQSCTLTGIASVSYGTQITPSVYYNVTDGANKIRGGTYSNCVTMNVEVLD